ncbi:hypothetical protein OKW21_001686 [Catalinimonas alkaloidigena]|uniref:hypothetical protein n=1 Tax=Catalinimonas alkaloidigena TaxID=1075417 RepID=UPI002406F049|nr:hypothetical protein [Catalinimonas alkaloidigena]MDF9796423.1 hypothetical protein [Catalinimonas alkaloidigena]
MADRKIQGGEYSGIRYANLVWRKTPPANMVIERLYGFSGNLNDKGQYAYYGKAEVCLVTGNEDGIKHCAMSLELVGSLFDLNRIGRQYILRVNKTHMICSHIIRDLLTTNGKLLNSL